MRQLHPFEVIADVSKSIDASARIKSNLLNFKKESRTPRAGAGMFSRAFEKNVF